MAGGKVLAITTMRTATNLHKSMRVDVWGTVAEGSLGPAKGDHGRTREVSATRALWREHTNLWRYPGHYKRIARFAWEAVVTNVNLFMVDVLIDIEVADGIDRGGRKVCRGGADIMTVLEIPKQDSAFHVRDELYDTRLAF
ncbi:hypothetical protein EIP86_002989 [Pleurotus ostreatoroseus]|nr:hypothetical protein EIP86_002989 [Pleurotus ostreatoroseus]